MAKRRKEQTIQWPKEEKNKQYNGQNSFLLLAIVLFVLFFFWPLYCLFFPSFGHCIVCSFWPKEEKNKQYNDQTKIDNITKTDLQNTT
jgi:ABC-type sugar transport system permease subunit